MVFTPEIIAFTIMTISDLILKSSKPDGVDLEEWRKQVQEKADAEEIWLKGELEED